VVEHGNTHILRILIWYYHVTWIGCNQGLACTLSAEWQMLCCLVLVKNAVMHSPLLPNLLLNSRHKLC
jgi:hypothetical protein